jgi:peptidoglycan/xylan/chitin deacetylase (PgdA/CDA1 family)
MSLKRAIKNNLRNLRRAAYHYKNLISDPSPKLLVPVYHRVLPEAGFNPLGTIVSLKSFTAQVEALAARYPIISMAEAVRQIQEGGAKAEIQVVLTFDDGYVDNYEVAFPVLKRMGIPAVFFLSSGYVGSDRPLWDWEVTKSLLTQKVRVGNLRLHGGKTLERGEAESDEVFLFRLIMELKKHNAPERELSVRAIYEQTGTGPDYEVGDRCMTWHEVRQMLSAKMEVGAHGITHQSLAWLPRSEAQREIRDSGSAVEKNIGAPCRYFAFPFGSASDFNEDLIEEVGAAGYESCLLNVHGYNHLGRAGHVGGDAFALKRIIMSEYVNIGHILG